MKTVIEMALEVGLIDFRDPLSGEYAKAVIEDLTAFAELVRADAIADAVEREREACAQIADQMTQHSYLGSVGQAIRARSST